MDTRRKNYLVPYNRQDTVVYTPDPTTFQAEFLDNGHVANAERYTDNASMDLYLRVTSKTTISLRVLCRLVLELFGSEIPFIRGGVLSQV